MGETGFFYPGGGNGANGDFQAAKEAEIGEIPVEEKEFESIEEAKLYAYKRQAERRNLTASEILAASMALRNKEARDGTGRASEILARGMGISPSTVKHAKAVAKEGSPEIIEQVKKNRMSIDKAYRLTKGKGGKGAGVKAEAGGESTVHGHDGLAVSIEPDKQAGHEGYPKNKNLERLEIWVHRKNINIVPGDVRIEAARTVLQNLRGFSLPEEFRQDIRMMLQALFIGDLEEGTEDGDPEEGTEGGDPDIWGSGE
jgi:hypothetical protein